MTPVGNPEAVLELLDVAAAAIEEKLLELRVERDADTATWCVCVARVYGVVRVELGPRRTVAEAFANVGLVDLARYVSSLPLRAGEALVVVTSPDGTQLHHRLLPVLGPRGDA